MLTFEMAARRLLVKGCCYRKLCAGSCINPTLSFAGLQSSILESLPSCTCPMRLFMTSTSSATKGPLSRMAASYVLWLIALDKQRKNQKMFRPWYSGPLPNAAMDQQP